MMLTSALLMEANMMLTSALLMEGNVNRAKDIHIVTCYGLIIGVWLTVGARGPHTVT